MATIRKRGSSYHAQVRKIGFPAITKSFKNLRLAEQWARNTESDLERHFLVTLPTSITVSDVLERFKQEIMPQHKGAGQERYKVHTIQRLMPSLRLSILSTAHIREYRDLRLKTVAPSTVSRELAVLRRAINYGIKEWGINLQNNPVSMVSLPKVGRGRDRRLEAGEEEQLLSASGELKQIIIIALETGMRRGEILNIKKSHIDFNRQTLLIPLTKTDTPRTIPLSSRAIKALREQLRGSQNVIPIEETTLFSYTARGLSGAFLRLCKKYELDNLHFHDLRHEATSRLFEKGLNPVEVATITGHKDTRMLMRYTHLRAEDLVKRLG
jgi:integrase